MFRAPIYERDWRPSCIVRRSYVVVSGAVVVSGDSSAQGRGLSSATTVYLQAPPQAALPKPEHRPNCRCPVNNYRVVVVNLSLGGNGWDGHPWNTECFSLSLSASVH